MGWKKLHFFVFGLTSVSCLDALVSGHGIVAVSFAVLAVLNLMFGVIEHVLEKR